MTYPVINQAFVLVTKALPYKDQKGLLPEIHRNWVHKIKVKSKKEAAVVDVVKVKLNLNKYYCYFCVHFCSFKLFREKDKNNVYSVMVYYNY